MGLQKLDSKWFELGPLQKKWLKALRSGKFSQSKGSLGNVRRNTYCPLGLALIACDLPRKIDDGFNLLSVNINSNSRAEKILYNDSYISIDDAKDLKLRSFLGNSKKLTKEEQQILKDFMSKKGYEIFKFGYLNRIGIPYLNDLICTPFSVIADMLETFPSFFFKGPA